MNSSSQGTTNCLKSSRTSILHCIAWVLFGAVFLTMGLSPKDGDAQSLKPAPKSKSADSNAKRTTGDPYFTPSKHKTKSTAATPETSSDTSVFQGPSNTLAVNRKTELTPIPGKPSASKDSIIRQPTKTLSPNPNSDSAFAPDGPGPKVGSSENVAQWDPTKRAAAPETENRFAREANQIGDMRTDSKIAKASFKSFEPGQVLAVVGGEPIFYGDLLFKANKLIEDKMAGAPQALKDQQRPKLIQLLLAPTIEAEMLYIDAIQGLPDGVDVDNILEQAGKEFDEKALPVILEKSKINSPSLYDAHLRSLGHSLRKMRKDWSKEQLTKYFLSERLNVSEDISHTELLAYYNEHLEEFDIPARVKWEQIMVRFDNFKTKADAKKAIVEMGNQIVYGAKLPAVAKRGSHGPRASKGGQHDWTKSGDLAYPVVEKQLFELPIGQLSDIVESLDGYHVLRVIERQQRSKRPFFDVQIEIKSKLLDQKRDKAFKKHIETIRQRIPVEIIDDQFKNKPEEQAAVGPGAPADSR